MLLFFLQQEHVLLPFLNPLSTTVSQGSPGATSWSLHPRRGVTAHRQFLPGLVNPKSLLPAASALLGSELCIPSFTGWFQQLFQTSPPNAALTELALLPSPSHTALLPPPAKCPNGNLPFPPPPHPVCPWGSSGSLSKQVSPLSRSPLLSHRSGDFLISSLPASAHGPGAHQAEAVRSLVHSVPTEKLRCARRCAGCRGCGCQPHGQVPVLMDLSFQ